MLGFILISVIVGGAIFIYQKERCGLNVVLCSKWEYKFTVSEVSLVDNVDEPVIDECIFCG